MSTPNFITIFIIKSLIDNDQNNTLKIYNLITITNTIKINT